MTAIYFDNQASTPLDPRVYAAMQPYLERLFGTVKEMDVDSIITLLETFEVW